MALTLAEGAKLSNDVLQRGVIETVINDSPVLQRLPFVEIVGLWTAGVCSTPGPRLGSWCGARASRTRRPCWAA